MGKINIRTMKTIIYIRTSTEEQNPENQIKDCESINHYGEYELIQDKQSAWKDNKEREGFEILKRKIKTGNVEHLIVWDFDRVYRNRQKFKEFLQFINAHKVKLHSYRQSWLEELHKVPEPWNEMFYEFFVNMFGWIAEEESKKKSDRVKIAHESGRHENWGRPSIPKSAQKEIIEMHNQGISLREIAKTVFYWDKSRNKRNVSLGSVHKTIAQSSTEKVRKEDVHQ